jgi:hypothetical protein
LTVHAILLLRCHFSPTAQRNAKVSVALDLPILPYAWIMTTGAPQATLIYWLSNSIFFMGLQKALAQPGIAKALRLPAVMLPPPRHDSEARGEHTSQMQCCSTPSAVT